MARLAGMLMMQEEIKACPFTPKEIYATSTLPAMVAKPEHMT